MLVVIQKLLYLHISSIFLACLCITTCVVSKLRLAGELEGDMWNVFGKTKLDPHTACHIWWSHQCMYMSFQHNGHSFRIWRREIGRRSGMARQIFSMPACPFPKILRTFPTTSSASSRRPTSRAVPRTRTYGGQLKIHFYSIEMRVINWWGFTCYVCANLFINLASTSFLCDYV